jgi:hypothetical protein
MSSPPLRILFGPAAPRLADQLTGVAIDNRFLVSFQRAADDIERLAIHGYLLPTEADHVRMRLQRAIRITVEKSKTRPI